MRNGRARGNNNRSINAAYRERFLIENRQLYALEIGQYMAVKWAISANLPTGSIGIQMNAGHILLDSKVCPLF